MITNIRGIKNKCQIVNCRFNQSLSDDLINCRPRCRLVNQNKCHIIKCVKSFYYLSNCSSNIYAVKSLFLHIHNIFSFYSIIIKRV